MRPPVLAPTSRRTWGLLALLSLTFAAAYVMQINEWNQNAHYALVRAIADGTPITDQTRHEIGDPASNPSGDDSPSAYVLAAVLLISAAVLSVAPLSGSRPTASFSRKDVAPHATTR